MAILSPSFVFGIVVLLYLSSFILFAILRIVTGISIQRIGYLSLRRLAYTPKDGIRVEIRGLGINLHRPTFAQPTWLSIVVSELAVTVDIEALEKQRGQKFRNTSTSGLDQDAADDPDYNTRPRQANGWSKHSDGGAVDSPRKNWDELNKLKERVKRLHRSIGWLRMVDIVATNSSLTILDVGTIQVGSYTVAVDTRRKIVDQGHIFSRKKQHKKQQSPAEWMVTMRSVLLTAEGHESLEVLDHAALNIHGLLYEEIDGLHEAAIEVKLGRLHIPLDDIEACLSCYRNCSKLFGGKNHETNATTEAPISDFKMEIGSESKVNTHHTSDFNDFLSSILRGIKEIQLAVTHIGLTKKIQNIQPGGIPLYFNASMKEVGIDLHRLDPKSPAHRMYFPPQTVAHQALLAALSVAIGVDDGHGKSDRLAYIPMATTTVRTTLPSRIVGFKGVQSADERNANIMFANIVITSPSVDLDPKHLPLLMALMQQRPKSTARSGQGSRKLISKFLPKANVKLSVHEPVFRIALPPVENDVDEDDFDLIISSISSVSLDMESSHSAEGDTHYALASTFRVQSHDLYYQTASAARYDLLQTESMELKVQINASPEVNVVASGSLQTFSVRMIRPELSAGISEIVRQLRTNVEPDKKARPKTSKTPLNFVRALPPWLLHFQFQGSNFSAEVAGIDADVSNDIRGVALQLESWTAEYRAHKGKITERKHSRRRASSRALTPEPDYYRSVSQSMEDKKDLSDGRRLAIHIRGLEGFVIESAEKWEFEPFLAMPRFEVAASTSSDTQGSIFHIDSHVKTLLVQYSLYRHYAIGVAGTVFRKAFVRNKTDTDLIPDTRTAVRDIDGQDHLSPMPYLPNMNRRELIENKLPLNEITTIDAKIVLVQVKANMPADPPMMIQVYGVEAGRHRYSQPFLHAKLARLYVEAPKMTRVWARLVSIKTAKINLRQTRHKISPGAFVEDNVIEIATEAIRLAVPHQVVLHKVFDNVVNTVKAIEQLHHRFKTGTNEYILEKVPEGPKHVPKISVRSKALLFEIEDGAFEWKLGNIYRSGLVEQQQRLAREEAFRAKARKIEEEEQRRDPTRTRTRSAHPRGRSTQNGWSHKRSKSEEYPRRRGRSRSTARHRRMRYDPEGLCGMSASAKISIQEAVEKLQHYNAQSWKRRIDQSYRTQMNGVKQLRGGFWGPDELPDDMEDTENILEVPQRPGLMSTLINDLHITIDKPSFAPSQLPEFLHRIGKGMPHDMKYSLLIPMHVQIDMGEARMSLRDYPLPLVHVPAMKLGQSLRLPSWSLKTDFVIAEEFRGAPSVRHVKVDIVPADPSKPNPGGFAIDVRRTVSPVKSYSDLKIDINTGFPTRITWGASYQPAIQDMMMVIENFTKPQIDPSDRTGFWDKIRLSFHSRLLVSWKGDGDVHLLLKGTRDPYAVTGNGAGFLMCWRNDVRWSVWRENDPKKFMTVESGDYILAIPDYSHQALQNAPSGRDNDSVASGDSFKNGAIFKKVIMKLSGNVQWLAGLVFERNIIGGKRSFNFIPHYDVIMKEPAFAKAAPGEEYDAFRGFRSNYIHLSVAVTAPMDRSWSVTNMVPSNSYNSVHLTPRFFTHFFAWWSMFGGTMSLPIRQGRLWPGIEKSSKKFGRHLATIKYSILLAPLFLSHVYKHKEAEDYSEDVVSVTGLKIKLDSFMLDIHQRREWFNTQDKGRKTQSKTTGMKIHKAQLDLVSADIRAMSATIAGTTPEDLKKASVSPPTSQQNMGTTDLSKFVIPDNDFSWIDMDDFVELDWILPAEANPQTRIMPLAYAPRFSYFRQTDHGNTIAGDPDRTSPFGNEPTHACVMSKDDNPRKVQCQLIQNRMDQLDQQLADHKRKMGEIELRHQQASGDDTSIKSEFDQMRGYDAVLREKHAFLKAMMHRLEVRIKKNIPNSMPDLELDPEVERPSYQNEETPPYGVGADNDNAATDFVSDFNNRFVIHNIQLKWNNSLRNTILRYIHQVSQRRGFVYYLSRRAVKFILDIVEEQNKAKAPKSNSPTSPSPQRPATSPAPGTGEHDPEFDIQQRIQGLLADSKKFVDANDPRNFESGARPSTEHLTSSIGKDFVPQNSYHVRLVAPQIQLQSDKNPSSVALVTAKGMELKVVEVMDKDRIFDEVSGLVQRRFSVEMDGTQFFVTHQKLFKSPLLSLYRGSQYGTRSGSAWPPWVPLEVMFDFEVDPFGFKRVVQKTSASLRYDKYNTLRLKYNDEVDRKDNITADSLDSRMDHLWVQFPHIRAICDSDQYYAMYIIVLDLLLYNEPLEKTRSEKLEKIMLASDFSDLRGAPEMLFRLQERIRQLEEIKTQFQIHSNYLDKKGWEDRILLDRDLTSCEDELFFMMKAITTSQRKYDGSQNNGLLRWNIASEEIVWHLMRDKDQPLMEFQLQKAEYDRTDNSDGSHVNLMQIGKIVGLNLLPDAIYPEMIAPYFDPERKGFPEAASQQMLRVYWYMLEAIAGIPVMDHFEVNLFPMKIQLEREVGMKLFEYIFPGSGDKSPGHMKGSAAFMKNIPLPQDEDVEENNNVSNNTPILFGPDEDSSDVNIRSRADSLELRLKPTMTSEIRPKTGVEQKKAKMGGLHHAYGAEGTPFRLFQPSKVHATKQQAMQSTESLGSFNTTRPPTISRTMSNFSTLEGGVAMSERKNKRFAITRNAKQDNGKSSDDLTKMLNRASNYRTLAYVKIPSVVICLSYKGKDQRNIEDLHDFVFRLPMLEYRNKTWSNLDLALALKKDVIKALISHTGAIIGNKFTKSRPSVAQQHRLRELATSNVLLIPSSHDTFHDFSDTSSTIASSPTDIRDRSKSPRRSFASNGSSLRPTSAGSSGAHSFNSHGRGPNIPSSLAMTKSNTSSRNDTDGEGGSQKRHSGDAYSFSGNVLNDKHGAGFMSGAMGRRLQALGSKKRDQVEVPLASSSIQHEEHSDANSLKRKLLGAKKILGGQDHD